MNLFNLSWRVATVGVVRLHLRARHLTETPEPRIVPVQKRIAEKGNWEPSTPSRGDSHVWSRVATRLVDFLLALWQRRIYKGQLWED